MGRCFLIDVYLIDVNGKIHDRKSMGEDVFWAIRGGSATSFGVILGWKIRLVRVPPIVTGFNIPRTPEEGATNLIHRWQHIAHELHEDLFIRAKDCTEMSWIQSVLFIAGYKKDDPLELLLDRITTFKSFFKAKSDFVKEPIPKSGLDGAWKMLLEEETLAMLILEPYGGRMDEISESDIPFPHRKGNLYNIQYLVKWEVNSDEESRRHLHWAKMVYKYMTPYVSKSPRAAYFNYKDLDLGKNKHENTSYSKASVWGEKYFKGNFRRLVHIKTTPNQERNAAFADISKVGDAISKWI
ncbi:hypothetical protein JHK86_009718 [Glycine max]|nr:hypothetical protein JHK86_009718 [Glycine max]